MYSGYRYFWLQREKQGEEPSPDPILGPTWVQSWAVAEVWSDMETQALPSRGLLV